MWGMGRTNIFWLDPMSKDGLKIATEIRPYTHELRLHAERALTLIAQARAAAPAAPVVARGRRATILLNRILRRRDLSARTDAIDALELGARRMDFIGLRFQLADEIAAGYQRALRDAGIQKTGSSGWM